MVSKTECPTQGFNISYKIVPTIPETVFNSCYAGHDLTGVFHVMDTSKPEQKYRLRACTKCAAKKTRCPFKGHFLEGVWRLDPSGKPEGSSHPKQGYVSRFDPLGKPEGSSHPKHGYHSYEGQIEVTQNFTTEARFPYAEREFRNVGEGIEMGQSQYTANVLRNLNAIGEWKFILGLAICFYRGPRRLVCRFLSELIVGITLIRLPKI
jgi:hypothetical protein